MLQDPDLKILSAEPTGQRERQYVLNRGRVTAGWVLIIEVKSICQETLNHPCHLTSRTTFERLQPEGRMCNLYPDSGCTMRDRR